MKSMSFTQSQLARIAFDIRGVTIGERYMPVTEKDYLTRPFCVVSEIAHANVAKQKKILVIAPLSGHFPILLRDLVIGLVPYHRVFVTNWINARCVPIGDGDFGFNENIGEIIELMRVLGPELDVIAICQGVVPTLAATAICSQSYREKTPRSLILIAGPVDPLSNSTPVVRLLRSRQLDWYIDNVIEQVSGPYAGRGRSVYPGHIQLKGLLAYLTRHVCQGRELLFKTLNDDGADPEQFPFMKLYTSNMDLTAEFFLDNVRIVFHERNICRGSLHWCGELVDLTAIDDTALMTVEGEYDDIAAPGQTHAAHKLCPSVPNNARRHLIVRRSGHFSLFHGHAWRSTVLPDLLAFLDDVATR